jgi:Rrf2 family nitric oxide-sensitive transcriptional repressor
MRLTRHTDYALRVLIYLGLRPARLSSIREIADSYGISENHLMKVAHRLGTAGFIETARGRGGGLRLARAADAIGIGDVVRQMEDDLALVECLGAANRCRIAGNCVLSGALQEGLAAFLAVLDRYTLADLVRPAPRLARLLGIDTRA